jgi:hypothetical protein
MAGNYTIGRGEDDTRPEVVSISPVAEPHLESAPTTGSRTFVVHRRVVGSVRGAGRCADALTAMLKGKANQ